MPFIESKRRQPILDGIEGAIETPGDKCFLEYHAMVKEWFDNPRWLTADRIAHVVFPKLSDWERARLLAFFVFFAYFVMPYEARKRSENGDILP